jgi:hypothetical protein
VVATSGIHGSLRAHLAGASHAAWWIVIGCSVVVLILGLVSTTPWANLTAQRAATQLEGGEGGGGAGRAMLAPS